MPREPITLYRLWCGGKKYSGWKTSRLDAMRAGVASGVTFEDKLRDGIFLGPLAWIEEGTRKYARSRTIPVRRHG